MQIFLALICLATISCTTTEVEKMSQPDWQSRMRELSLAFSKLTFLAAKEGAFLDPKNHETIENEIKNISDIAVQIHSASTSIKFDKDPVLAYVTNDFSRNMKLANDEFKKGHRLYARSVIQSASNYCISCHTRTNQGQHNTGFYLESDVKDLSFLDRANFFAAVRQFPQALDEFDKALTDSQTRENPRLWANGIKKSLAIAVRVNRDPSLALELVSRVFDAHSVPESLRGDAQVWRRSIKEWQESKSSGTDSSFATAKKLIQSAQITNSKSQSSEAGLIYYLRASTLLHDLLSNPKLPNTAEVLYTAGLTAEGLKEINLWTFDEIYYEACVRKSPHTAVAKKCYSRFEALQFFSNRIYLDELIVPTTEVKSKLQELKTLAF